MAGDVSITRGIGFREDFQTNNNWNNFFPPSGSIAQSTDGDINTVTAVFGAGTLAFDETYIFRTTGISSARPPYNAVAIQVSTDDLTDLLLRLDVRSGGGPVASFTITPSVVNVLEYKPFDMGTGSTIDEIRFTVRKTTAGARTYTLKINFIQTFKETLTLPAPSQPLPVELARNLGEISIPGREGGILQDMGSSSLRLELEGDLITTTTPNNYTKDQWWDVLMGLTLERNWQWLKSDRVNCKFQPELFIARQMPGNTSFYPFRLRGRKVDVLTATAASFGAIQ